MELIKAKNVCKQFAAPKKLFSKKKSVVNAMQDFTLSINEGEILGLIGESGSGKTTFARVLLGLTGANSGSIMVGDVDTLNMVFTDVENLEVCGISDEYFDLIARTSHTPDSDERTKMVGEAERMISDNMLLVPLVTAENNFVFANDVSGIEIVGNGAVFFNDMK